MSIVFFPHLFLYLCLVLKMDKCVILKQHLSQRLPEGTNTGRPEVERIKVDGKDA